MATNENTWAWSATAADNATSDASINWAEGQDPNTVNNSARSMMAAIKKLENVLCGNVTVGGSANAIQITTGQTISPSHQGLGFRICFTAQAYNTGATTVAVDGLPAVAVKRLNNDELSAGDIYPGGMYDIGFDGTNYKLLGASGVASSYGVLTGGNTWSGSNTFAGNVAVGNDFADAVDIMGVRVSSASATLLGNSSAAAWQISLFPALPAQWHVIASTGVGWSTASIDQLLATSTTMPLLNGTNTWSGSNSFTGNVVVGNDASDAVDIMGTRVSSYSSGLLGLSNVAAWWSALGINTTASYNIGTSGGTVPLLNGNNTWSNTQNHTVAVGTVNQYLNLTGADGTGYYQVLFGANSGLVGSISQTIFGVTGGNVAYNTTSDERLKRARTPLVDSGPIIDQLAPIRFRWMADDGPEDFGFSAQALHAVVPQAVTPGKGNPGDKDFVPWMREKGALEAILVAEIQSLRARVAALEANGNSA